MFDNLTKKKLQELAEENDLPTSGNKDEIIERLVEAGVPEPEPEETEPQEEPEEELEEGEAEQEEQEGTDEPLDEGHNEEVGFGSPEAQPQVRQDTGVVTTETLNPEPKVDNPPAEKGYAVDDQGRRLVKMTKPAVRHGIGGGRAFTKSHPFLLLTPEEAEIYVNQSGFRYASIEEARDYYG